MFSGAFSGPTSMLVIFSDRRRTRVRSGATSLTHIAIGAAVMRVLTSTGLFTAMVFGVTSPSNNSSGTISRRLMIATCSAL